MTEQFKLVRGYDFQADAGEVSLLDDTDGWHIKYGGWTPQGVADKNGNIIETITLIGTGANTDALATAVQKIAAKQEEARRYWENPFETNAVWLRVQLDGETNARQTLVRQLDHEAIASAYEVGWRQDHMINGYTVAVKRPDWWEAVTPGTITAGSVNMLGGTLAYGPIAGDLPARLAQVKLQGLAASTAQIWPNGQMWLGFRSDRYGTPSAWVSSAELDVSGTASTSAGDSQSVGGTSIRFTAPWSGTGSSIRGTAVPYKVAALNIGSATGGTPARMFGKFLVLLRAKAASYNNASTVQFNVRLATGYANDYGVGKNTIYGERYYPRVPVFTVGARNNHIYHLHELGVVQFPPDKALPGVNYSDFTLYIYAENILAPGGGSGPSGNYSGGTLFLDNLVFIPADDGYYSAGRDAGDASNAAVWSNDTALVYQGNNWPNELSGGIVSGTARTYGVNTPYNTGGVPAGTGIVVLAAHSWGTVPNYPTWQGSVTLNPISRWQSLRGTA